MIDYDNFDEYWKNFRKKNLLEKIFLKIFSNKDYKMYKEAILLYKSAQELKEGNSKTDFYFNEVNNLTFSHSGRLGDIIFSLATVKYLSKQNKSNYYLKSYQSAHPAEFYSRFHPNGFNMLTSEAISRIIPLIKSQDYISECKLLENEPVEYDLDLFRQIKMPLHIYDLCRVYFHLFGISFDLSEPWLKVTGNSEYSDKIIISRSYRYRNLFIDYSFLNEYKNLVFIGIESEFQNMRTILPKLDWVQVNDFLDMTEIISGCKLFIGNQSFPYSIAEALKKPRILECCAISPNVIPEGKYAWPFLYQKEFEFLVKNFLIR